MSEIKRQFYEVFGVEPKYYCGDEYIFEAMLENECTDGNLEKCKTCEKVGRTYPQITDRILLNLLCIINKYGNIVSSYNIEKLRDEILIKTIILNEDIDIKPQVRALFLNK